MPPPGPARPVAPLVREQSYMGTGHAVVGVGGLALALATIDGPLRGVILFAVAAAVVGLAGWLRQGWIATAEAPPASASAARETARDTRRRTAVVVAPAALLIGGAFLVGGGLAALAAGVVAGTAAGELRGARVAHRRGVADGVDLWRELGPHPFAGPRRPIYLVPRSASTLRT